MVCSMACTEWVPQGLAWLRAAGPGVRPHKPRSGSSHGATRRPVASHFAGFEVEEPLVDRCDAPDPGQVEVGTELVPPLVTPARPADPGAVHTELLLRCLGEHDVVTVHDDDRCPPDVPAEPGDRLSRRCGSSAETTSTSPQPPQVLESARHTTCAASSASLSPPTTKDPATASRPHSATHGSSAPASPRHPTHPVLRHLKKRQQDVRLGSLAHVRCQHPRPIVGRRAWRSRADCERRRGCATRGDQRRSRVSEFFAKG
jgi:hypothetical protein